jgi:integrase
MTIRQRGTAWQVDVMVEGKRVRETCATLALAQEREVALTQDGGLTISVLRDKTIARVWADQKSAEKSIEVSSLVVRGIGPNVRVTDLNARLIDDFIAGLEKQGNSNGTINRKLAVLSKMLHFAKQREYIDSVPHIQFKRAAKGRDRFLTPDEEARILAVFKLWSQTDMHDLVVFLLDTGARVGEALKLEWSDFQLKDGVCRVTFRDTKNSTTRSVPLTKRVEKIALTRLGLVGRSRPFDLNYTQVRDMWERMREHLTIKDKDFVIHMLRHTCASRLVQRGASIQYVKEWLGHKTLAMTMRYAHLAPTSLDSMVSLLEQQPVEKPRHLGVVEGGQQ